MPTEVFVSCDHTDVAFAQALQAELGSLDIKTWMYTGTRNGAIFKSEIDQNLRAASLIVVVVSPKSMKSSFVAYEYSYARFALKKELYFAYLKRCRNNTGIFGILREDDWFPSKCLNGDLTQAAYVAKGIQERFEVFHELRIAGGKLVDPDGLDSAQIDAANILGATDFYKAEARKYLLNALKFQLQRGKGYGPLQEAIVGALGRVGDITAMAYLKKLYEFTRDKNVRKTINSALKELSDQEDNKPL